MAFGKVYEINFQTKEKNVYPVVYMNKDYFVCKQNGTTMPRTFSRKEENAFNGRVYVVDLDIFKTKGDGCVNRAWIYAPHGIEEDFSEFYTRSQLELELERAEYWCGQLNNSREIYKNRVENYMANVKNSEEKIKECDKALAEQAGLIAKLKKQIKEEKRQRMEKENANE